MLPDEPAPSQNPYQTPQGMAVSMDAGSAEGKMDGAANMLRQTKPWVRLMSVMMFIGSAFMVLGGSFVMIASVAGPTVGVTTVVGIVYVAMAFIYIVPAVYLWKYAARIDTFVRQRTAGTLTSALEAQKSFWRFVGIAMLVILGIYVGIFVFAIIAGVASSM